MLFATCIILTFIRNLNIIQKQTQVSLQPCLLCRNRANRFYLNLFVRMISTTMQVYSCGLVLIIKLLCIYLFIAKLSDTYMYVTELSVFLFSMFKILCLCPHLGHIKMWTKCIYLAFGSTSCSHYIYIYIYNVSTGYWQI